MHKICRQGESVRRGYRIFITNMQLVENCCINMNSYIKRVTRVKYGFILPLTFINGSLTV